MRRSRAALALAGCGAASLVLAGVMLTRPGSGASEAPQIGGPFTLTDGAGRRVSDRDFRGVWKLVYFGYTHCPDACPTTLGDIGAALDRLPANIRAHYRVLFVTVDPARDTPPVMAAYTHAFGPEFVGLTGGPADLGPMEESFHVYARRRDLKGGYYAMDHSSIIYVMRPDGSFAGLLDDGMKPSDLAKRLIGFGA